MEKRSWLWKKKSSEKSPCDTDSSGSISSHSERYSDEQETLKESPNHHPLSPEVTSKVVIPNGEVNDTINILTEKLSAALVNVGAKEDLVKQHAKVAEEAVAGWEKAENEVAILKQQLEAAVQQNLGLEVRVNHLDGALKECVRQLRQSREEQVQRIDEALAEKTREWETTKVKLENQLTELQNKAEAVEVENPASIDPSVFLKLKSLEKENSVLKLELLSLSEEVEIMTIERDLSMQAAETASKQQLESIKKAVKLEAECRRLQAVVRKSSSVNDHKSQGASSLYVESLTDSQSDNGERLKTLEIETWKMSRVETNGYEPSCSDSWASALIAELDQFKTEKTSTKNLTSCSLDIDIMDDFLEMERLAALPEAKSKTCDTETESVACESNNVGNSLRAELETMSQRVAELEDKLEKMEAEKTELEKALNASQDSIQESNARLTETETRLEELQKELSLVNESKELLAIQLVGMEVEAHTMSTEVDTLKAEVVKERSLSTEMVVKCHKLENELTRKAQEVELQKTTSSNGKVKQEDLAVAADKLAECQKTIASLGRQLKSLATLEDFLIDTANVPRPSGGESPVSKRDQNNSSLPGEKSSPSVNGNNEESPASSSSSTSSTVSLNHVTSAKSKSGFGKLFPRSKNVVQLENHQG